MIYTPTPHQEFIAAYRPIRHPRNPECFIPILVWEALVPNKNILVLFSRHDILEDYLKRLRGYIEKNSKILGITETAIIKGPHKLRLSNDTTIRFMVVNDDYSHGDALRGMSTDTLVITDLCKINNSNLAILEPIAAGTFNGCIPKIVVLEADQETNDSTH